jgi:prepilin-type N-terminal cleavage/methylation domain-containing protein
MKIAVSRRRGFTLVELVVVVIVVLIAIAVAVPGCQSSRTQANRITCTNNLKEIGVALHKHLDYYRKFPASSWGPGTGWSWLTYLLPYCGQEALYEQIDLKSDPWSFRGSSAGSTEISIFQCPDYDGPTATAALTNYKAMGASHPASLAGHGNYPGQHPDGAMFPNVKNNISALTDGTSYTVMVAEAIDPTADWWSGFSATVVGLPDSVSYSNTHGHGAFYAPEGFNGQYDENSGTADLPTYLSQSDMMVGPGSYHPNVVNHLWADGSVNSVSRDIDAALYFFIITRAGGDPRPRFQADEGG